MNIETLTPDIWLANEEECKNYFNDEIHWNAVPLVNENNLINKKFVRFRGMVQDMYNPEYYYEKYEVVNKTSNEKIIKSGKYVTAAECQSNEYISTMLNGIQQLSERQSLLVVPIPWLNDWVIEESHKNGLKMHPAKRPFVDEEGTLDNKRLKTEGGHTSTGGVSSENQCDKSVLCNTSYQVKIYKDDVKLSLNEMIDIIGFISLDSEPLDDDENQMEMDSPQTPSIHCVAMKKIDDCGPFINETLEVLKMKEIKKELQFLFTQLFMGDSVASEYFIYYLISKVYARNDVFPLGAVSLNISNIPVGEVPDFGEKFYKFIELLVSKSHYFPMTLENMNSIDFIPKKNYDTNKLKRGLLQVSDNTHLMLDETKLLPGRLAETGVKNIEAVSDTMKNQKVKYDFSFYQMDYNCDISFIVVSEGKSLLPCNYQVPLCPDQREIHIYSEIVNSAQKFLNPQLLRDIRIYLSAARRGVYDISISNEMLELIQNDFVTMRQSKETTPDDLHKLLILAKLICLSEGTIVMDPTSWKKACCLEESRKTRLS